MEEVSSNKVSILGVVDSTFKEVQSKLCEHRQRIENQIQRQSNAEKEKIEVYIKRNLNFQESLKESVSFCENILSNRSDLKVVYFLDDMKLSLLKCSNSNKEEYQSSLQRLEVNVKGEIHRLINATETLVDSTKSTNEMTSGKPSVVDKETNTAFVDQECFEISINNTRGSEKFTGKDTKTTAMDTKSLSFVIYETISVSPDQTCFEKSSTETQERNSENESRTNTRCITAVIPTCLKTYDLSDVSNEKDKCYTSVTWIGESSFALADEQNQTATIVSNVQENTIVRSHPVKGIVAIASFNDYLACKTQSGDIFIYSFSEWKLERPFKGAYALSSRSSELIWVTKEKIITFANSSFEEKTIKDECGQSFKFGRPSHLCCLPNKSSAITDKLHGCLYILEEKGHISSKLTLPGHIRALSCDNDNLIYMTCYETNSVCILDTTGSCVRTVSLQCILN